MKRLYPSDITSYDLLKAFAVIIMIIDHIGTYFYPDVMWWKAIGRIGFPIWFFLVGHASGRDVGGKLLWGAVILLVANVMTGMPIFPLNALFTIIAIRLLIDPVMGYALRSNAHLILMSAFLFFLVLPTGIFVEYGSLALITAMFGYLVRHRGERVDSDTVFYFMGFALITFVLYQQLTYGFSLYEFLFMAIGTFIVRSLLCFFDSRTYSDLTRNLPGFAVYLIQLGGRKTLEIYVIHLIVFKFAALVLGTTEGAFLKPLVF